MTTQVTIPIILRCRRRLQSITNARISSWAQRLDHYLPNMAMNATRSSRARVKDDGGIGTLPLKESGIVASWDVPKRGTGSGLEE